MKIKNDTIRRFENDLTVHQPFFIVDHALAGIFGDVQASCIHADRVFRTNLDAETAINTFTQIKHKLGGILFNIGIRMFGSRDFNTSSRTNGLAHHASDATRRTIFALHQAMACP